MKKRLSLKIYGQVQGVNYRSWAFALARELGISGFIKNSSDGAVEIVAEGDQRVLQKFLDSCYNGSEYAKVEDIEFNWARATGEFSDFGIKY